MPAETHSVDWIYLDQADEAHIHKGELISIEAGGMPIYQVMEIGQGRVWLRDTRDGADRVCRCDAFHWKAVIQA
ncbi:MAG: hypothetical protein KGL69_06725 [Alphaproteobacteria bacterium]|nr:hypothetical protein [Alphaproteobacteria bacterium]